MDILINNCKNFQGICLFDSFGNYKKENYSKEILWSIEILTKDVKKKILQNGYCVVKFKITYFEKENARLLNLFFLKQGFTPIWINFYELKCVISQYKSNYNVDLLCSECFREFKKPLTLSTHIKKFHSTTSTERDTFSFCIE